MTERLPYADEIAALRARIDAGQHLMKVNQLVSTALTAVSIVEVQHGQGLPVPKMVPGEDAVDEAIASLPELADLGVIFDRATDYKSCLDARRQQLLLASQHLEPRLGELEELAGRMHHLQHEQHHELAKPEWAEAVERLKEIAQARDAIAKLLTPLRTQVAYVTPVQDMLLAFHPQLQEELIAAARTDDPDGRIAWRAAMIAQQQLLGLQQVAEQLGLSLGLPTEPQVPDAPHPRHRRRLRHEAGDVLQWMVELSQALGDHGRALREQLEGMESELAKYETALEELMG
ncbi:MAG: hypothetical protein H6737_07815 [Alphaproteobacteria bacterium]|nr:hypothetical protein [Alphaproteobacteria bacterium]